MSDTRDRLPRRRRTRKDLLLRALATALALAVGASCVMLPAPDAHADVTATDRSHGSILRYLKRQGGEVVVPDGRYSGGSVATTRDEWLVLRAESPGGVVLDLSDTGLQLDEGTNKVVFVGFTFVNGTVQLAGAKDVLFWYCDFSFPPEEWARQYEGAGGSVPADRSDRNRFASRMPNLLPTAIRMGAGSESGTANARIGFYGSDFHDLGDDAIFLTHARNLQLEGLRIWNVDEKASDPGQSLGSTQDWFHNDGIQTVGAISDVEIADSWIAQKIQWGTEDGDIVDADFRRLWLAGSGTFGQVNGTTNGGKILRNTQEDIRGFANGQKNGASYDKLRTDFVDGVQQAIWPEQYRRAGTFEMDTTRVNLEVPRGITMRDGMLTDVTQVRDHAANPANVWRTRHPYRAWKSFVRTG